MPKIKQIASTVSIAPAIYIQVAGGLKPALTKNSSVAGTVILPTMCGMKKAPQMMRRMLNSFGRLNLSAHDIGIPPKAYYEGRKIALLDARAKPYPRPVS